MKPGLESGARPRRQGGYVLILTLFILALFTLIAARFGERIDNLRTETAAWEKYTLASIATSSARAEAIFALTTTPLTPGGFGAQPDNLLIPDDRPYATSTNGFASLLDLRATLGLNFVNRPLLRDYLLANDIPPDRAEQLLDVLEDYVDADGLRRLNGAEEADYHAIGLPPPSNDWLRSTAELRRMPGWRDYPQLLENIARDASTRRNTLYNPNFFSDRLLSVLPGATPELVRDFIAQRKERLFRDATDATVRTGWPFDSENMIFHPGDEYRLRIWSADSPQGIEMTLLLTPAGTQPWWIYETRPMHHVPDLKLANRYPLAAADARKDAWPATTRPPESRTVPAEAVPRLPLPDNARPRGLGHTPAQDRAGEPTP